MNDGAREHVLIVDDDPSVGHMVTTALEEYGYATTAVENGGHALTRLQARPPIDVLLLDISLPDLDGFRVLQLVQDRLGDRAPKVIMLSAAGDVATKVRAFNAGANDYLAKPFHPAELVARIETQMRVRRAETALGNRERFLVSLSQITQSALQTPDFQTMMQTLADQLGALFAADGCYITLWQEETQQAITGAAYGPMRETYRDFQPEAGEATLTDAVLTRGRPLVVENVLDTPYLSSRIARAFPAQAMLGLPLVVDRRRLGAALIAFQKPHVFTAEEVARGEQVAAQVALALAKGRLLNEERQQRRLAETLREVAAIVNSSLSPSEVLEVILSQLARVLEFDSASLMLLEGEQLRSVALRSVHAGGRQGTTLPIARFAHIQEVLTLRRPVIIADTLRDGRWQTLPRTQQIRCWLGVPLRVRERVIGLLNLSTRRPRFYTEREAQLALSFANQAAIALENAQLYSSLRDHAHNLEAHVQERTLALTEAYERLQELDRLKSKFIEDISHELRTPVTNLNLYLDLWERASAQKRAGYLEVLQGQAGRLTELVEGIITLSQLDLMKGQMAFDSVDLNEIIRLTSATQRQRAEALGLALNLGLAPALPAIHGDQRLLAEMLGHLLKNAISYTPAGSVWVRTSLEEDGRAICLAVQDTGVGIAEADLPHLFERFYRGQSVGQSNKPGIGLGLTMAREIVILHRGEIEIDSDVDQGTLVRIRLPVSSGRPPTGPLPDTGALAARRAAAV